jgi:restriction endonuclease Mrr
VLEKLGAQSQVTKQTNDGGVDFIGVDLKLVPKKFNVPAACRAAVIGQAKRYKDGNAINEVRLRGFVGAALLRRHVLHQEGNIGPLTPVLCAFWTTSYFDFNAKKYARAAGLWYMDGRTLADYVHGLSLRGFVMTMPDKP